VLSPIVCLRTQRAAVASLTRKTEQCTPAPPASSPQTLYVRDCMFVARVGGALAGLRGPLINVLVVNFSCVKFTGGTSLLLRFSTFSGLEAVLAISVMIFSDIQPEPHIAVRMACDPDCWYFKSHAGWFARTFNQRPRHCRPARQPPEIRPPPPNWRRR
jgi:hypothetical protein